MENMVSNPGIEAMRGNLNFIDVESSKIGRFFVMVKRDRCIFTNFKKQSL